MSNNIQTHSTHKNICTKIKTKKNGVDKKTLCFNLFFTSNVVVASDPERRPLKAWTRAFYYRAKQNTYTHGHTKCIFETKKTAQLVYLFRFISVVGSEKKNCTSVCLTYPNTINRTKLLYKMFSLFICSLGML